MFLNINTITTSCVLVFVTLRGTIGVAPLYEYESNGILGEYLVLLKRDTLVNVKENVMLLKQNIENLDGIKVITDITYHTFGALHIFSTDSNQLQHLRYHPSVEAIEQNHETYLAGGSNNQCALQATGNDIWGLSRINSVEKPIYNFANYQYNVNDGTDVDVYVIDSGVNIKHVEFEGRAVWGYTATFVQGEGNTDKNGHGTHVAGTIAGKTYGVAKKANIISVKVANGSAIASVVSTVSGLEWAANDNDAKSRQLGKKKKAVINLSMDLLFDAYNHTHEELLLTIIEQGIPVVTSAGNHATDACTESPARMSSLITVGASNRDDQLCYNSNYGPCVDIIAPGGNILSAWILSDTNVAHMDGTSCAAAHVSGVVAQHLSHTEEPLSVADVKARLIDHATTGKIIFYYEQDALHNTPNRLLHTECFKNTPTPAPTTQVPFDLIAVILAATTLVVLVGSIVALCARKSDRCQRFCHGRGHNHLQSEE